MKTIYAARLALAAQLLIACGGEDPPASRCEGDACEQDEGAASEEQDDDELDAGRDAGRGSGRDARVGDRADARTGGPSARDAGVTGVERDGGAPAAARDGGAAPAAEPPSSDAEKSAGCGVESVPEAGSKTLDVAGTMREYIVGLPQNYDPNRPYRLVFAWHGLGGTAAMIARSWYGLTQHAEDSAIFIAGQGLPGTGQQSGFAAWANVGDSDIAFTRAMLEWAKESYCVDIKRVFSIGMSNGGMMSNVVGCELGDSFRALAAMSGGGPQGYAMQPCTGQLAVWIAHGNTDNNVPFSYGERSRDYWTNANNCGSETAPAMPGSCLEYQGCDEGFPVQFCEFDGGHMIPSFTAEAAWKFFARF